MHTKSLILVQINCLSGPVVPWQIQWRHLLHDWVEAQHLLEGMLDGDQPFDAPGGIDCLCNHPSTETPHLSCMEPRLCKQPPSAPQSNLAAFILLSFQTHPLANPPQVHNCSEKAVLNYIISTSNKKQTKLATNWWTQQEAWLLKGQMFQEMVNTSAFLFRWNSPRLKWSPTLTGCLASSSSSASYLWFPSLWWLSTSWSNA